MIIRSKAPLRLGIAGGGTDVSPYCDQFGGCVLNATIDLYAYCTIQERTDGHLCFYAADRRERFEAPAAAQLPLDGCLDLHKAAYNRIVREYGGGKPLSFTMTTFCDAPAGSGLGSSSTLVVAVIQAYAEWLSLPLGEYDIAKMAYEIERIDVGLLGGRQDQYAAAFGGFNFIEFYANEKVIVNPLRIKNWIVSELEHSMILYYTGASRESGRIIEQQVRRVQNNDRRSIEAMHELKADAQIIKECILKGDTMTFARYLDKSWHAKKRIASAISNDKIDAIYEQVKRAGAYAGKVSGAGGGGFMIFMVDPVRRLQVVETLQTFEGKVIHFHFTKNGAQGWRV